MAALSDILYAFKLPGTENEVVLTAHFNGGPILIYTDDNGVQKTHTFAADPFFRRPDHNIAVGSLTFRVPFGAGVRPLIITVQFANMFAIDVQPPGAAPTVFYHAELSSPTDKTSLKVFDGKLNFNEAQSIVISIYRN